MQSHLFERLAPSIKAHWVTTVVPTGVMTQVLPRRKERWGLWIMPSGGGAAFVCPLIEGVTPGNGFYLTPNVNDPILLNFCDWGEIIHEPWGVVHAFGVDHTFWFLEFTLPADAWTHIYSESMQDMRPRAPLQFEEMNR